MDFALLGIRYDRTQTCRKGAAKAPALLRKAFNLAETYVSGTDLQEAGMEDLGSISPKNMVELARQAGARLGKAGGLPVILGGEHSISLACVKALKPANVVILDAHPDCMKSEGHDGVARKLIGLLGKERVFIHGIRAMAREEEEYMAKHGIRQAGLEELGRIRGPVYLSIDLDVLDPSIMPTVGNPEPGGKSFQELVGAIRAVAPNIMAMDFVEFTPSGSAGLDRIYASIAASIIYRALAETIKARKQP